MVSVTGTMHFLHVISDCFISVDLAKAPYGGRRSPSAEAGLKGIFISFILLEIVQCVLFYRCVAPAAATI